MKRLNFTLDEEAIQLLKELAGKYYRGNKSRTVRAALESLATHIGHNGWIISGYSPVAIETVQFCHTCGTAHETGEVLFKPVFELGQSPGAHSKIPDEVWLDCSNCVEQRGIV